MSTQALVSKAKHLSQANCNGYIQCPQDHDDVSPENLGVTFQKAPVTSSRQDLMSQVQAPAASHPALQTLKRKFRARFRKKRSNYTDIGSIKTKALVSVLLSTGLLVAATDCDILSTGFNEINGGTACCDFSGITCQGDRVVEMFVVLKLITFSKIKGVTGFIPLDIGSITELVRLKIDGSSLSGTLPDSMVELTKITRIEVWESFNQEVIVFPAVVRNMKTIVYLEFWYNTMTGGLPEWVCEMTWITDSLWYELHLS